MIWSERVGGELFVEDGILICGPEVFEPLVHPVISHQIGITDVFILGSPGTYVIPFFGYYHCFRRKIGVFIAGTVLLVGGKLGLGCGRKH